MMKVFQCWQILCLSVLVPLTGCLQQTQPAADADVRDATTLVDRGAADAGPPPTDAALSIDAQVSDAQPPNDANAPIMDAFIRDAAPSVDAALRMDAEPAIDAAPAIDAEAVYVSAGGPYAALEGQPLDVDGEVRGADVMAWQWQLGDQAWASDGPRTTVTPMDDGEHPLTLTVELADGRNVVRETVIEVEDATPTLFWHPPTSVWVDEPVRLPSPDCQGSPGDAVARIEVDLGSGVLPVGEAPIEQTWALVGPVEIITRCADEDSMIEQRVTVNVVGRDRDGDGVVDADDACPDHPPPFSCDGPCADGFPLAEGPDLVEAMRRNLATNERMVAALRELDLPPELIALAELPLRLDCGPRDICITDGEDVDLAILLFDQLAQNDLPPSTRRCVDAAADFRLGQSARRVDFVCGLRSQPAGDMSTVRRLRPWVGADGHATRCMRLGVYNGCMAAAFPAQNPPRPRPEDCPPTLAFDVDDGVRRQAGSVGRRMALAVQCTGPDVEWRVDWGDGLPPEYGVWPAQAARQWTSVGEYSVELTCRRGGAVSSFMQPVRVR